MKYASPSSPNSSTAPFHRSPSDVTTLSVSPATHQLLELRLMHHYTSMTSKSLSALTSTATEEAWQISVPGLAFDCPCLMDAIMAVSALHLRTINPHDYSLVRASHSYMASCLSRYSSSLGAGVDASNAEALFVTSALIAFQASASRCFQDESLDRADGDDNYVLPLQWFHSFQGVKAVVMASWQWLRTSEKVRPIIAAQPPLSLDLTSNKPKFFGFLLEGLEDELESMDTFTRLETKQAYEHAVAYLCWSHVKPERRRLLGFPATVSRRFVELIEARVPRALVIVSCFFAMTKSVDDVWWLRGVAKREVAGMLTLLPPEARPLMDWAVRVANAEGPIDEETWGSCRGANATPEDEALAGEVHEHIDILAQFAS